MALPEISVSGRGMNVTDSIRRYVIEKIGKYSEIYNKFVTGIEVECTQNTAARGVKGDFSVEITAHLPKVIARVEKQGADLYGLVDLATDVLIRKIKKYKERLRHRNDEKEVKSEDFSDFEAEDNFVGYIPRISKKKIIDDCKSVLPEEAIEKMEMLDYDNFLFKDSKSGLCSMVYRRKDGTYGLVQLQPETEYSPGSE